MDAYQRARFFSDSGIALAGVIWGVNYVIIKYALGIMPPMYYLGTRFTLAFLLLSLFCARRISRLNRQELMWAAGIGTILFLGFVLYTAGLARVTPGISGFLSSLYVVLVPLAVALWTKQAPSPLVAVGVALVLGGMAALRLSGHLGFGWGEGLTLAATVFWALHILSVSYAAPRVDPYALTAVQLGVTGLLGLVASVSFEYPPAFPGWEGVAAIVYTAVMGGIVGYLLMTHGQRYTPATLAGILISLETVVALLASAIVGYDKLTARSLLGFGLIFAGTTVARLGYRGREEPAGR